MLFISFNCKQSEKVVLFWKLTFGFCNSETFFCFLVQWPSLNWIIESAAYCNQKLLAHFYLNTTQNTSVNWIIRLLLSLLCWPKVILLSSGNCALKNCTATGCITCFFSSFIRGHVDWFYHSWPNEKLLPKTKQKK